jgi:hypothetical protein
MSGIVRQRAVPIAFSLCALDLALRRLTLTLTRSPIIVQLLMSRLKEGKLAGKRRFLCSESSQLIIQCVSICLYRT